MQATLPVVQNHKVYDIIGNNHCVANDCTTANDWFESRLAEPDVLLEDLINIITPEAHPVRGCLSFSVPAGAWWADRRGRRLLHLAAAFWPRVCRIAADHDLG